MSARGFVLVTGAGRRVGAVIAKTLAGAGWGVLAHCHRSRAEALQVAGDIVARGGRAEVVYADLASQADIDAMADALGARGDWVGLVNSAAIFERDDIADFAFAPAAKQLEVNLIAPIYLARRLKQALGLRQGFVVNVADQKVLNPNPDFLSYTLSKIALAQATDTLAMALAPNVRVACVAAGLMLPSGEQTQENFARVHDQTLTGRGATPEDVAAAIAFLAGADNVTGAILAVDGGQHLVASARDVMFT